MIPSACFPWPPLAEPFMSYLILDLPHLAIPDGINAGWLAGQALMLWTLSAAVVVWQRTRPRAG